MLNRRWLVAAGASQESKVSALMKSAGSRAPPPKRQSAKKYDARFTKNEKYTEIEQIKISTKTLFIRKI